MRLQVIIEHAEEMNGYQTAECLYNVAHAIEEMVGADSGDQRHSGKVRLPHDEDSPVAGEWRFLEDR